MIIGFILLIIATGLGIYSWNAYHKRGPILSNSYLWASEEERRKMDFNKEYQLVSRVFGGLAIAVFFLSIGLITKYYVLNMIAVIVLILIAIYAIYDAFHSIKK